MSENRLETEYRKLLVQTIDSRKQYNFLCGELQKYEGLNIQCTERISELVKILSDLESEYQRLAPLSESVSVHGDSLSSEFEPSTFDRSLPFQRFSTRESEFSPQFPNFIPEVQEDPKLKLFEHFLVIAPDPESIDSQEVPACLLFDYPKLSDEELALYEQIKSIIFPDNIEGKMLDDSENQFDQVSYILYKSRERDSNSFILSFDPIKSEAPYGKPGMVNNEKTQLYCCCLKFNDIAPDSFNKQLLVVCKCYCFLTYLPCFDLHFEVLYKLLLMLRGKIVDESNYQLTYFETYSDISLMFKNSGEGLGLLDSVFEYYNDPNVDLFSDVSINSQTVGSIDYCFPGEFYYLDKKWVCHLMFSVLSLYDFVSLIFAAMTEKKIVFVYEDLDALSSCVLGLQSLIMPLSRQKNIFPVLSKEHLKKTLKLPHFIVGAAKPEDLDDSLLANTMVVQINERENNLTLNRAKLDTRKDTGITYDIIDKLKKDYSKFNEEHLFRKIDCPRKKPVYTQTDDQGQAYENIIEETKKFILWSLNQIKNCCNLSVQYKPEPICNSVRKSISLSNQDFFIEVIKTEAFEAYYNTISPS